MNRDPLPTNDDAFFSAPEPKTPPKKWGQRKLWFIALGLLFLAIVGLLARQPVANLIGT
jgi:hypothetical protein